MTERRCRGCRCWYDTKLQACPDCGVEPFRFNAGLAGQQWASALNAKAATAARER